jgi:hypothetical protein
MARGAAQALRRREAHVALVRRRLRGPPPPRRAQARDLLTAELIALSYYRVLAQAYEDPVLAAACERILLDERGHVAFHRSTLSLEFAEMAPAARTAAVLAWRGFVAATVKVVALDHREVLALAAVSRGEFEREVRGRARRLAEAVRRGPVEEPAWT